jgi:hypothetical protein
MSRQYGAAAWSGKSRRCGAMLARRDMSLHGKVGQGPAWCGEAGSALPCVAKLCRARRSVALLCIGAARLAGQGNASPGRIRRVIALRGWHGSSRLATAGQGTSLRCNARRCAAGKAGHGASRHDTASPGQAQHGSAWRGWPCAAGRSQARLSSSGHGRCKSMLAGPVPAGLRKHAACRGNARLACRGSACLGAAESLRSSAWCGWRCFVWAWRGRAQRIRPRPGMAKLSGRVLARRGEAERGSSRRSSGEARPGPARLGKAGQGEAGLAGQSRPLCGVAWPVTAKLSGRIHGRARRGAVRPCQSLSVKARLAWLCPSESSHCTVRYGDAGRGWLVLACHCGSQSAPGEARCGLSLLARDTTGRNVCASA